MSGWKRIPRRSDALDDRRTDPCWRWWFALMSLALVPAAANGFGRFGYGLVLPAMRHDLGWSGLISGSVNAANTAGYLVGAVVADRVLTMLGERAAVLGSLTVCALAVLGCSATGDVLVLLALRMLAGLTGAVAFVNGAGALMRLTADARTQTAGRLLGLYFAGPGLGIAISAHLVTPMAVAGHWRSSWLLLGALCLACVAVVATARVPLVRAPRTARKMARSWERRRIAALLASYGLFGAGYIVFVTFSVAYRHGTGSSPEELTWFWFTLGATGIPIALFVAAPISRMRGGRGVAAILAVTALASALPLISTAPIAGTVSAALFASFFSVTAVVTVYARRHLPPRQWPSAIAGLTAAFGVGQIAGPVIGGAVADQLSMAAALLTGTTLLTASALCALLQPAASGHPGEAPPR